MIWPDLNYFLGFTWISVAACSNWLPADNQTKHRTRLKMITTTNSLPHKGQNKQR